MTFKSEIWRPFTQMKSAHPPNEVSKAKNATLFLKNGRELVDAISSWWVITHGHCQPEIVHAIQEQVKNIDQVLFANFTHRPAEELVAKLGKLLPKRLNKFFFSDNGSTAVESALKMTIQYWQHLGEGQRCLFLSFENSYHGDTVGAMSVGGDNAFTTPYKNMLFKVLKVKQGRLSTDSVEEFVRHFEEAIQIHGEKLAGVILEPLIQGAGGMIVWPVAALEKINTLCQKEGIVLIFDEVMTGFGRTGSLFAFDKLSFAPDILCLSKGLTGGMLPLSLTIADQRIFDTFLSDDKGKMFFHGHSFTGNPISCAAALANIDLLAAQNCQKEWERIEKVNHERMSSIKNEDFVADTRMCGTMAAIEVISDKEGYTSRFSDYFTAYAIERGVFLRPLGNVIYILPPYSIEDSQLHKTWDTIESLKKIRSLTGGISLC